MRMLRISSVDELIVKSMNLLEPALSDADGNQHEDGNFFFSSILLLNANLCCTSWFLCSEKLFSLLLLDELSKRALITLKTN